MTYEQERRAADSVEWLAALWQLMGPGEPRGANPHLRSLLRFSPRLSAHPALDRVKRLRRVQSRDQLVKAAVSAAYGEGAALSELQEPLQTLVAEAEELLGAAPFQLIQQARAEAAQRVADLAGDLDPAADLAEVTGELLPLRVVLAPSVFLPPPQTGRHGVLLRGPEGWVAHLHFGFPLRHDPEQFSINRSWLLGGAWHYAIHLYLERYWPAIALRLADDDELARTVSLALGSPAESERRPWTDFLRAHVNVALKGLLSRRLGLPDTVHRAFAQASGLVFFPWFEQWLRDSCAEGAALAAHISALPEALTTARPLWERLARSGTSAAPTINLTLISPSARRACLVLPDEWTEEAAAAAVAGWRLLPLPVLRYGEWLRTRASEAGPSEGGPVIAFGEPECNPLVRRVLDQRGLSLAGLAGADPAIMALSSPGFEEAAWCIAVAVTRPETAVPLHMEMALRQTSVYVLFDSGTVVGSGRVPLDQLAPAG